MGNNGKAAIKSENHRKQKIPGCLQTVFLEILAGKEHIDCPAMSRNSSFHMHRMTSGTGSSWRTQRSVAFEGRVGMSLPRSARLGAGADHGADNCPAQSV